MTEGASTSGPDRATIETLRLVKSVEAEWDEKLRLAREEAAATVARTQAETEATVKAVAAEAEAERVRQVEAARTLADREAESIRADGAKEADALRRQKGKRTADRPAELIAAVLGPFAKD